MAGLFFFFSHIYLKSIGANDVLEEGNVPKDTVRYLNVWQEWIQGHIR